MIFTNGAYRSSAEAALVLLAVGCVADSGGMNLAAAVGAGMRVDDVAGIPLSCPGYAGLSAGAGRDYIPTTLLTTHRGYARRYAASLIEGVLRRHPEGGARRGGRRRRLVPVSLREARDPARQALRPGCEELAARFRKANARRCRTAGAEGDGSAAPRPKTATVERREASVPRYGMQGASLGAWRIAS